MLNRTMHRLILQKQLMAALELLETPHGSDRYGNISWAELAITEIARDPEGIKLITQSILNNRLVPFLDAGSDLDFVFGAMAKTQYGLSLLEKTNAISRMVCVAASSSEHNVRYSYVRCLNAISETQGGANLFAPQDVKILKLRAALEPNADIRDGIAGIFLNLLKHKPQANYVKAQNGDVLFDALADHGNTDNFFKVQEILTKRCAAKRKAYTPRIRAGATNTPP